MTRRLLCICVFFMLGLSVFAGDVAQFVDLGFSPDGRYYMFGQYGVTDKTWQGYAEIYTVDMDKNAFVPAGVFKSGPSAATAGKTGKAVFDELLKKADPVMKKYAVSTVNEGLPLYVMNESSAENGQIEFRDFENTSAGASGAQTYAVRITKLTDGKGSDVESSFYLIIEKRDASGAVTERFTGGSPAVRRRGVSDYRIQSIFPDRSGKYLLFVVEKEITDSTGLSVRYMVEAVAP